MSTLSLDPAVSLFEPAARPVAAAPRTAAPARAERPAARPEALPRHGRHADRPQAAHARRTPSRSTVAALGRTAGHVAVRTLGTSVAAAAVTLALIAKSTGGDAEGAALSLRGLAAAAVICAAWGFQDRARLGALGATRAWYGTAAAVALVHTLWFSTTLPGRWQDRPSLAIAVFTLDVVLVVVPALLGARAGRPEPPIAA